jgi:hypothetical protein
MIAAALEILAAGGIIAFVAFSLLCLVGMASAM